MAAAVEKMPGIPGLKEIPPGELSQRVAVVKRFKELLKAQRDRFRAYLESLDRQQDVILGGSAEDLLRHVEFEEKIVKDIFSIQKVIAPLEKMYQASGRPGPAEPGTADEVTGLREALDGLKAGAVLRSERNRELLSQRMAVLRSEIKSIRSSPYAIRRSGNAASPTRIDIKG